MTCDVWLKVKRSFHYLMKTMVLDLSNGYRQFMYEKEKSLKYVRSERSALFAKHDI